MLKLNDKMEKEGTSTQEIEALETLSRRMMGDVLSALKPLNRQAGDKGG